MSNKTIISFSHTNYCIRSAGTEKFIRELSHNLQKNSYSHLNIFSFYDDKGRMKTKLFGVNYNDHFLGIFRYLDLLEIIDSLAFKYQMQICGIHLQHLLHHDLELIKKLIFKISVPVYIFAHDYYLVCPELKLISTNCGYCGLSVPSHKKCNGCLHGKTSVEHFKVMNTFLNDITPLLKKIITPSAYVAKGMREIYPQFADIIVVRPHLIYEKGSTQDKIDGKIRIAFAGGQMAAKGYNEWRKLVEDLADYNYELYYLGAGKECIPGVTNVYVSSAEQGDNAMAEALKKNNIHCAFLWPNWAETYSYVLYELAENGIYILTNDISGNICDVVNKEQNGKVFHTFDECENYLMDEEKSRNEIDCYRTEGAYHIKNVKQNLALSDVVNNIVDGYIIKKKTRANIRLFETFLYLIKYRKAIFR